MNTKTLTEEKNNEKTTNTAEQTNNTEQQTTEQVQTDKDLLLDEITKLVDEYKTTDKVIIDNFAIRIVHCFTDDDKAKHEKQYKIMEQIKERVKKINFDYAIFDNKYFYIVNKTNDDEKQYYNVIIKLKKANKKILTITPTNIEKIKPIIDKFLTAIEKKQAEQNKEQTTDNNDEKK